MTNPGPPSTSQRVPYGEHSSRKPNSRIIIALFSIGFIAVAALVVGIIDMVRPASSDAGSATSISSTASSTSASSEAADAKKTLCNVYQVASRAVKADTNGTDPAMARISLTNAASMLDAAANNGALQQSEKDAARNLASAYRSEVAISSVFDKTSTVFLEAVDDVNHADVRMAAMCP